MKIVDCTVGNSTLVIYLGGAFQATLKRPGIIHQLFLLEAKSPFLYLRKLMPNNNSKTKSNDFNWSALRVCCYICCKLMKHNQNRAAFHCNVQLDRLHFIFYLEQKFNPLINSVINFSTNNSKHDRNLLRVMAATSFKTWKKALTIVILPYTAMMPLWCICGFNNKDLHSH